MKRGITGAPDLVVEVASPGTATYDRLTKYELYARSGVPEYWIVKTNVRTVEVLQLVEGGYHSIGVFHGQMKVLSGVVPDWPVVAEQFFPEDTLQQT